jgi:jasmonate ZIM domain-containing protein
MIYLHDLVVLFNYSGFNSIPAKEAKTAQLTLFYNGEVIVLDDFPAYKVEELKSFAKPQIQPPSPLIIGGN